MLSWMKVVSSNHDTRSVLLSRRFSSPSLPVLLGRARLFADRLELSGVGWTGLWRRTIALSDLSRAEWFMGDRAAALLVLHLHGGEAVQLRLRGAGLWKCTIENHARHLASEEPRLPGAMAPAA